jgi:predicted peptidase
VERADPFTLRKFRNARRQTLYYRLFVPAGYNRQRPHPLALWLHGLGGDKKILHAENQTGVWRVLGQPAQQEKYPAFVVVPRCPPGMAWIDYDTGGPSTALRLALEILRDLGAEFNLDARRLSVLGYSMGGEGTWELIAWQHEMFAAAVPISCAGDTSQANLIARTPVWAFHGAADEAVSVEESRRMIAAIRRAGGQPRYTEYAGVGHDCAPRALAEPELLPWLARQQRR